MARTPLLTLRVDDATKASWEAAAAAAGCTLSEWLRDAADEHLARNAHRAPPASRSSRRKAEPTRSGHPRVGLCIHRRGPDEFCSRCDA